MSVRAKMKMIGTLILTACIMFTLAACKDSAGVKKHVAEAKARNDGPAIYVVTDPKNEAAGTFYIYPTIEALPVDEDFRRTDLDALIAQVGTLYFPVSSSNNASLDDITEMTRTYGLLPDGEKISDYLPNLVQKRLIAASLNDDAPVDEFDGYQPWYAARLLYHRLYAAQGLSYNWGVIRQGQALYRDQGKYIAHFETWQNDIKRNAALSKDAQSEYLDYLLSAPEGTPFDVKAMQAWLDGEAENIAPAYIEAMTSLAPTYYQELIVPRQGEWADRIAASVNKGETALIFVDMIYVFGEGGIFERLRDRGLSVARYNHADKGPVIKTIDLSIDPNRDGL